MNTYAEQYNFFALYPMQPQSSNQNECWNWFLPQHQARGSGEPQIITSMVTAGTRRLARGHVHVRVWLTRAASGAAIPADQHLAGVRRGPLRYACSFAALPSHAVAQRALRCR